MPNTQETFSGTYNFCVGCPTKINCCTGKTVDLPVITPEEIKNISTYTGLEKNEFSISTETSLSKMKSNEEKCYFYHNGRCSIYAFRPIDCRLYPFDVLKESNGEFFLISYTNACPKPINIMSYIDTAKSLLSHLGRYLSEFAEHNALYLDRYEFIEIEKIHPNYPSSKLSGFSATPPK